MRIAITHAFSWPEVRRGAERFIQELGAALMSRGHDAVVLSAAWDPVDSTLDGLTTVRLRRFLTDPLAHEADFGIRVTPRLLAGRFDAVHSLGRHDAVASIRAATVHQRRRTVFTDLGSPDRSYWRSVGRHQLLAVRRVVRSVDVYGCMSKYSLAILERDWGRADGVLTQGGVNMDTFAPAEHRAPQPTFLYSGALDVPRKGVADLLHAMAVVIEREPDAVLWLSGPGDPSEVLDGAPPAAKERTRLLDLGAPDEVPDRYAQAWVTVLPSMHDSFGMVCVESLACGTPVVVTDHGAPKEAVTPGLTGEICRPHAPADLAAAMLRALDLSRRAGTVQACREAAAPYDWRTGLAPRFERYYGAA